MALDLARMAASFLRFTTRLLTGFADIFAFTEFMTLLATEVGSTLEFTSAHLAATNFRQPARLILE